VNTFSNDSRLTLTESEPQKSPVRRRFEDANWGSLTIVFGLIVSWLIFGLVNDRFLTPLSLTNLMLQIAALGTLAASTFLILLLSEIDLSASVVSGLSAGVMAVLNVKAGVPGPIAVLAGILTGTLIGLFQGLWVTRLRIPSFIVTLAGMIGWQGVLMWMLGSTGTINLRDNFITGIAGTFFKQPLVGLAIGATLVASYAGSLLLDRRQRLAAGLSAGSMRNLILRVLLMTTIAGPALLVFYADRGLPLVVVIFIGVVIFVDGLTKRTVYGRHIYAVGGHAESARRAGIHVERVRLSVFALASMIAAIAGIMAASRLSAANRASGSSDFLLNAIAAAIIGGTSLFGGRGSAWSAVLGALVIGTIANGMDLVGFKTGSDFIISLKSLMTAGVLLAAVTLDVATRRRRESAGR
jgi:D-xylose transport system permease protein